MSIDWKKVAMAMTLADGKVDDAEIKVLQKELKTDGAFQEDGVTFLCELRVTAQKKAKAKKEELSKTFEEFFFKVIKGYVLKDGKISEQEAGWLRTNLFADKKVDDAEWAFLEDLNKKAKEKDAAFTKLYDDAKAMRDEAAAKAAKAAAKKEKAPVAAATAAASSS